MAPSDAGLPAGVAARPLGEADIAQALALTEEAGWNQRAADWRIFLERGAATGLWRGERLIATAAILPHGAQVGWISMVLVTATERRQGLARWLLRRAVAGLQEKRVVPVLDATPAGRAVYAGLGFADGWRLTRLVARTLALPARTEGRTSVRPLAGADWPRLLACDGAVFAGDRGALLRLLARRLPAAAWVAERDGRLAGFVLGRDGRVMTQLGPLAAEDESVARALVAHALGALAAPVVMDVPDRHAGFTAGLAAMGFAAERSFTRMVLGPVGAIGDADRYFAIGGPELG